MFKNASAVLKVLAHFQFFGGIVASFVIAVFASMGIYDAAGQFWIFVLCLIGGFLVSWASACMSFAIGQICDHTKAIKKRFDSLDSSNNA